MKRGIHWQLMTAFAAFTLGVTLLFGLFAMVFAYEVEDRFFGQLLTQEAKLQQQQHKINESWLTPQSHFIRLHTTTETLPADLALQLAREPQRKEFFGTEGRHYHVLYMTERGKAPLLVAEVSQLLVVRPMREALLRWLAAWGLGMVALSLTLAWWLARRTSAPLERLASQVALADPAHLPQEIIGQSRSDEIGTVARGLDALMKRTRKFIEREQLFTRDTSHELRTPLSVMRIAMERLQDDARLPKDVHPQINAVQAAVQLMEQTVNTLLLLAREESHATTGDVLILPLIEKWMLAHESWLDQQQVSLSLELSPQDRIALPEPVVQLLLANLLGNAVAHGTRGGVIRIGIEIGALSIANLSAEIPAAADEAYIKGEASAGFGLGLSIVRRLLARYDATLTISHHDGITLVRVVVSSSDHSQSHE
jgi:signal transduction histidine kinase